MCIFSFFSKINYDIRDIHDIHDIRIIFMIFEYHVDRFMNIEYHEYKHYIQLMHVIK